DAVRSPLQREVTFETSASEATVNAVERQGRFIEMRQTAHLLRGEHRRQRNVFRTNLESAGQLPKQPLLEWFGRPNPGGSRPLGRHPGESSNDRRKVDLADFALAIDRPRVRQADLDLPGHVRSIDTPGKVGDDSTFLRQRNSPAEFGWQSCGRA